MGGPDEQGEATKANGYSCERVGLLGGEEGQILVNLVSVPSLPMLLPLEEGGRSTGEGSVAERAALLGGLRSLAKD